MERKFLVCSAATDFEMSLWLWHHALLGYVRSLLRLCGGPRRFSCKSRIYCTICFSVKTHLNSFIVNRCVHLFRAIPRKFKYLLHRVRDLAALYDDAELFLPRRNDNLVVVNVYFWRN